MTDITSIIASISYIADTVKYIQKSRSSLDDAESKLKLADLINNLADAKVGLACLRLEIEEKNGRILDLEKLLENQSAFVFRNNFYYKEGDEVPYCPNCYESNRDNIHLSTEEWDRKKGHHFRRCPKCNHDYKTRDRNRDSRITRIVI